MLIGSMEPIFLVLLNSCLTGGVRGYEAALALAREIRCPYDEARALEGAGRSLACLGSAREGRAFLCQALAIDERLQVPDADRLRALLSDA
ncbi:hypothetical protein [Streptomyces sp. NPDC088246]|uniref:hypothetical protein n=1 Tax=Streptomyces sp. NPDC088246 TaxID=3365842 RepID=UPI00381D4E8E